MKNLYLIIISLIMSFAATAQDMNRILVNSTDGSYKSFNIERTESVTFANVVGDVYANVVVHDVTLESLTVSVTRTQACQGFKLTCLPTVLAGQLDDAALAKYIDDSEPNAYYQDFQEGLMTGIELEANSEYTLATVGIDEYGTLCEVRRVEFTTPSVPLVGNPQVTAEVTDEQQYSFTVKFTPNADVAGYAYVAGEKGTMQSQYEMFAPMFGFTNFGDMITAWGVPATEEETYTWTDMAPNTEYEVFIQAWDVNGTYAEYSVIEVSTLGMGGEGEATVTITVGDYRLNDWLGEMLPSQFITYTPNDQASCYRFNVYLASEYDADAENLKAFLQSEPPMPMEGWYYYEELTTDYQIDPSSEVVVIASAKNINGEWGPINEVRFTTPDTPGAAAAKKNAIMQRSAAKQTHTAGKVPSNLTGKSGIQLIQR